MKRLLLITAFLLASTDVGAQVYTGGGVGVPIAPIAPYGVPRYRLRQDYPMYPIAPGVPVGDPNTAVVGQPYPYGYGYGYPGAYGYPGIVSDGDTVYVPGR